jgi:hypothetical protein
MQAGGQLLTEDAEQDFFSLTYPTGPDKKFVAYYFEIRQLPGSGDVHIHGLPSPNALITFNLNNRCWRSVNENNGKNILHQGAQVLGQTSVLHTGMYPAGMHAFFVKLKPGMASLLFRENAPVFENDQIDLKDLWKGSYPEERIAACKTFNERIAAFQDILLERIVPGHTFGKVEKLNDMMDVLSSLRLKEENNIETICKTHWITYSSARRDFRRYIGFTPKYCQKVLRLKEALKEYKKSGFGFCYEDFGYTDFSHFAKDSKQLTGSTPSLLL